MKINLKTPITYYGGKQKLLPYVLPRIEKQSHHCYNEPFCGGAAVFFAKQQSDIEVLNDTNKELINFYSVLKNRYADLEPLIRVTLHSRSLHRDASTIYNNAHLFDEVKRAWALWVQSSQSFSAMIDGSWGYDKTENHTSKKIQSKIRMFSEDLAIRLQNVQLESTDATYVIQSRDSKTTLHYIDPPYIGSDCGHYDGYTEDDYEKRLQVLSKIQGKFLLSGYPSDLLKRYSNEFKWHLWSIEQKVSVNAKSGYLKKKVEVLAANYPID